ncbi:glycerate kinase [Variovorax sp. VNK109]|uniref:glycerate kinase n=1 Tax=Variovorax sp. VNK109 TaxID=3400919 RepID=UPI003C1247B7
MNLRKVSALVGGIVLLAAAWRAWGWQGVALAIGGIIMYLLLHFNRMMQAFKRASERPLGHVGSAVMLNARLKPGVNLLHVIAMTKALGVQLSKPDEQPEVFRWTDGTNSHVTCEFVNGKLAKWELWRPGEAAGEAPLD